MNRSGLAKLDGQLTRALWENWAVRVTLVSGDTTLHAVVRAHLASNEPDWQLAAHTCGARAWRALRTTPPELVLLERTLPDGGGLEWLRRCQGRFPGLPVVIVTLRGCAHTLLEALLAGARGYWVKSGDGAGLVAQLRKALAGKLALGDEAERLLPEALAGLRRRRATPWGLSPREADIMTALCRQLTNKEIASGLGLSPATVHAHLAHIFKKLNVHDRKAAMKKFSKHLWGGGENAGRGFERTRPFLDHLVDCRLIGRMI